MEPRNQFQRSSLLDCASNFTYVAVHHAILQSNIMGGVLTYLAERGCATLFYKKSLNVGPIFYQKILGFSHGENPENHEIFTATHSAAILWVLCCPTIGLYSFVQEDYSKIFDTLAMLEPFFSYKLQIQFAHDGSIKARRVRHHEPTKKKKKKKIHTGINCERYMWKLNISGGIYKCSEQSPNPSVTFLEDKPSSKRENMHPCQNRTHNLPNIRRMLSYCCIQL